MKTNITTILLAMCGALALSAGCGKNETTQTPAAAAPSLQADAAAKAAEAAKAETMKQQAAAETLAVEKAAADKVAAEKLAQTTAAAAQEQVRIQDLIDTARNLTGQNKYAEALKVIGELSNLTLSPKQQTVVDELKKTAEQQAAQAVADKAAAGAAKSIGDALGGKK